VGTRDVQTQSARAVPAHDRARAQSVPSPVPSPCLVPPVLVPMPNPCPCPCPCRAQSVPNSRPCSCLVRAQPAPSQALSQTDRPSELIYMIETILQNSISVMSFLMKMFWNKMWTLLNIKNRWKCFKYIFHDFLMHCEINFQLVGARGRRPLWSPPWVPVTFGHCEVL
jgi:hypothetical protein